MSTTTDDATQKHFRQVQEYGKIGWRQAVESISQGKIPPMPHSQFGLGYVVRGTISGFIRSGCRAKSTKMPSKATLEFTRKFLRLSQNMVVLEKIEDYEFKIFVRAEWKDDWSILPMVYQRREQSDNWYERKITPEEAGETMAQAPVEELTASIQCNCGLYFETAEALQAHVPKCPEHKGGTGVYTCQHCGERFTETWHLANHVGIEHPHHTGRRKKRNGEVQRDEHGRALAQCPHCGGTWVSQGLHNHVRRCPQNPKQKPHPPSQRQSERKRWTKWATSGELPDDMQPPDITFAVTEQWDEDRQSYVCPLCDRDFNAHQGLVRHKEGHINQWAKWMATDGVKRLQAQSDPSAMGNDALLDELRSRLDSPTESDESRRIREEHEVLLQRHELIRSIVAEVNKGELAPLKALSDIEASLDL